MKYEEIEYDYIASVVIKKLKHKLYDKAYSQVEDEFKPKNMNWIKDIIWYYNNTDEFLEKVKIRYYTLINIEVAEAIKTKPKR